MKTGLRLLLVTLTVGGGFAGFAVTLPHLLKPSTHEPLHLAIIVGFLTLYLFVVVSGLLFTLDQKRTLPLLVTFVIQLPWFSSPFFAYRFSSGFQITVGVIAGRFNGGLHLGSDWQCSVLQNAPWGIGINIFALLIIVLLWQSRRLIRSAQS